MAKKTKEPKVKIGDRFDKLEALKQVEITIKKRVKDEYGNNKLVDTDRKKVGWLCKCDCGEEIEVAEDTLLKSRSTLRSCDKCRPVANLNHTSNIMSPEEKKEWDELYEYVRTNIMKYDKSQSLSRSMVARLKGLMCGKYMVNYKTPDNASYSYKTLLNTFKFCSLDIQRALSNSNFKDENHKFNYIAKIVEQSINTVYVKEKQAERAKEEAKKTNVGLEDYKEAEYKPKKNKKDRFNDLW